MKAYQLAVIMFFAVILGVCSGQASVLVDNHKATGIIVVPEGTVLASGEAQGKKNLKSVSDGAQELQKYIEKATGAKLDIIAEDKLDKSGLSRPKIFVGPCKETKDVVDIEKLQPEGFVIKTKDANIYIAGRDRTPAGMAVDGTYYGCNEFLEKYVGVRWLMPGELGEVVPRMASLNIGKADIKQEPVLWQRKIRDVELKGHKDRIPQILEGWGVSVTEWQKFYTTEITGPWFTHQRLGDRVRLEYGHAFNGWWDKYHTKYPDIFAMQPDGTRNDGSYREKFCVSNPQYWQLVADEKIKELKANPLLTAASISPNDGGGAQHCCCDKCKAWDPPEGAKVADDDPDTKAEGAQQSLTDRYFRSYNEIAKLAAKEVPDRYLGCYAYSIYRVPPVKLDHLEQNLIVGFVGFNSYMNDQVLKKDRDYWLEWGKLAKQLFIRPNLFWFSMGMPMNYTHKFASDIRFMADHGMRAADYDGLIGNWGTEGLDYYVAAKLLWNPYADVNAIVDDYCNAAYGKGAPAMKTYYAELEVLTNKIAADGYYKSDSTSNMRINADKFVSYYSDDVLKGFRKQLDEAVAAIGNSDPCAVARVKLVAAGLDYVPHVRELICAAAAVRKGKSTKSQYQIVFDRENKYFASMAMNWSVSMAHNYSYIRNTLSLKPEK